MKEYPGLKRKVEEYQNILQNTQNYRQAWKDGLKDFIVKEIQKLKLATGLQGKIQTKRKVGNAEAVIFTMGKSASGLFVVVDEDTNTPIVKDFGSLVYQQLFNGKIQVFILLPHIEGFGQPQPPRLIAIYRPEEIKSPYLERHLEEFIRVLTEWEDFDDDDPTAPIGFHTNNLQLPNQKGK